MPLVCIQGVYVLPGIPRLFKQMLGAHKDRFQGPPFVSAAVYTHTPEGDLAELLQRVVASAPDVQVGSYPYTGKPGEQSYGVKIQLSGRSPEALQTALDTVRQLVDTFELAPEQT